MKAVVWQGVGDVRLEDVPDPSIRDATDAVIEVATSALCGTDLHFVRGTMSGTVEDTVLGHEAVGVVREVGAGVRNLRPGDRVVVPSTVGCGYCSYCRSGYYAQCDNAIDPASVLTQDQPLVSAIDAYTSFDEREAGWTKVVLEPSA